VILTGCRAVTRMHAALALSSAAAESGLDVVELDRAYAGIGDTVSLAWLYAAISASSGDPHWVQLAKAALRDELAALTVELATDVVRSGGLDLWASRHQDGLARARTAYEDLAGSGDVDVAKLTAGVQVLRDLCHAVGA
jgi:glutamate dehydrogenase